MPGQGFRPKARRPRGLEDRRGGALARERDAIAAISKVYEKWGFEALETSALEYADALGKFLPDQDRPNEGVFAFTDDDEQWLSLRYDLTAPLARFVAENYDALPKPYRRWAAGPYGATKSRDRGATASSGNATPIRLAARARRRTPK